MEWLSQEVVSLSGRDVQGCQRASLSWAMLDHLANVPSQSENTHSTVKGGTCCCTGRAEGGRLPRPRVLGDTHGLPPPATNCSHSAQKGGKTVPHVGPPGTDCAPRLYPQG